MKHKKTKRYIRMILLLIIAVCLIKLGQAYFGLSRHKAQQRELMELAGQQAQKERESQFGLGVEKAWMTASKLITPEGQTAEATEEAYETPEPQTPVILARYQELHEKNSDMAGWLSIEGTQIDYPVMQCGDDEYYLHHDFYGEESRYGCLYVRNRADTDDGTNFVIYGHNMKDGAMFGELDFYKQESFYLTHPTISFDTLYEERTYEIVAAFLSQVYDEEDETFKYYQFYGAENQDEFEDFYRNIKALSLYDTGVKASFGDTFLTLSTCAYHVADGRFVVVAKRIM